jgi:hypothetical protein
MENEISHDIPIFIIDEFPYIFPYCTEFPMDLPFPQQRQRMKPGKQVAAHIDDAERLPLRQLVLWLRTLDIMEIRQARRKFMGKVVTDGIFFSPTWCRLVDFTNKHCLPSGNSY